MKYTEAEMCLIWLDSFIGLEYRHKEQIYKLVSDQPEIRRTLERAREYFVTEIGEKEFNVVLNSANGNYFSSVMEGLDKRGIRAVTIVSDDYPENLKNIPIPPLVLYCKGDVILLNGENFGIVGSRKSLPVSRAVAANYAESLTNAGFTIVSGIAEGIDSTALSKTISSNGKAITIVAGGFDHVYPKSNQALFDTISEKGLCISEQPPETVPQPFMFPVRNRLIAALSQGVLVVSGGLKSGTMYTAKYAEEYSKEVFAVPYTPGIESGAGCNELIKSGAHLTDSPDDILDFYGKRAEKKAPDLSEDEKAVIEVLKNGATHADAICKSLDKKIYEIMPILSALMIKGLAAKAGTNAYCLTRNQAEE